MLHLALHLPQLALDLAFPAYAPAPSEPWAIVDSGSRPPHIHASTPQAFSLGIVPGQKLSTALALSSRLQLREYNPAAEEQALQRLAAWALQFTPQVSLCGADALLLDIGSCLDFFGGLPDLLQGVDAGLAGLGYTCQRACAPTPLAALWRARAGQTQPLTQQADIAAAVHDLPLDILRLPAEVEKTLLLMGMRQLGDLLQLPQAGLGRRFGSWLPRQLQQALGEEADLRPSFAAPDCFSSRLELAWATERISDVLLVLRRMLNELCGYLTGRGLAVQQLSLSLEHENRSQTCISLGFGQPSRQVDYLFAIARERLERQELQATVAALRLQAEHMLPLTASTQDLFGDGSHARQLDLLHSRLRARLGEQALRGVALAADHRPERAWQEVPVQLRPAVTDTPGTPGTSAGRAAGGRPAGKRTRASPPGTPLRQGGAPAASGRPAPLTSAPLPDLACAEAARPHFGSDASLTAARPPWLLPVPQQLPVVEHRPWYGEPLVDLSRPERIESGWWDAQPQRRDYYCARGQHSGRRLWIFQECASRQWFVHGLFD